MTHSSDPSVIHIVLNDFINDNRVFRSAALAGQQGLHTLVFALHSPSQVETEKFEFFTVCRLKLKSRQLGRLRILQVLKYLEGLIRMVWLGIKLSPTLVHAHDLSALPIGYLIAKITRARLIYDSHELWSGYSQKSNWPAWLYNGAMAIEKSLARQADVIITVSEGIAQQLQQDWQLVQMPITLKNVPESPPSHVFRRPGPLRLSLDIPNHYPIVLYQGGISSGRGLECLVESMQYLEENNAQIVFLGNGPLVDKLVSRTVHLGLQERIHFHKAVPAHELAYWTQDADIGIAPISNTCESYRLCLPNKLFEYMHAGIPVLVSDLPEMARIVYQYEFGETFEDGNAQSLAVQLDGMLKNPSRLKTYAEKAKEAALLFNWEKEQVILQSVYQTLLGSPSEIDR